MIGSLDPESQFPSRDGAEKSLCPCGGGKWYDVVVPAMLQVRVLADDSLHAEVAAQDALREVGVVMASEAVEVYVKFLSLLCPVVRDVEGVS